MPRPMLIRKAVRFMRRSRSRCIMPSVAGVCGTVMMTKSARGSSASSCSGLVQLVHALRSIGPSRVHADHAHAECVAQARRLGADAAHAEDQSSRLGQVHDAGIERPGAILATHLLRQVGVKIAREGEDERHDVRADVIVIDLAEIGDHDGMRDELGIIEAGRRSGLRGLQPAQPPRGSQHLGRDRAEGGVGIGDISHRFLHGLGLQHAHSGLVSGDAARPSFF